MEMDPPAVAKQLLKRRGIRGNLFGMAP